MDVFTPTMYRRIQQLYFASKIIGDVVDLNYVLSSRYPTFSNEL
jgi:hypothetical protein